MSRRFQLAPDKRSATMLFNKHYTIGRGTAAARRGEVVQELRWQKDGGRLAHRQQNATCGLFAQRKEAPSEISRAIVR
ncbi:MAG: hypothetical protein WKF84_17030 [Pyrinomonadaceae bacterium]